LLEQRFDLITDEARAFSALEVRIIVRAEL
jgi:hypothetical protein